MYCRVLITSSLSFTLSFTAVFHSPWIIERLLSFNKIALRNLFLKQINLSIFCHKTNAYGFFKLFLFLDNHWFIFLPQVIEKCKFLFVHTLIPLKLFTIVLKRPVKFTARLYSHNLYSHLIPFMKKLKASNDDRERKSINDYAWLFIYGTDPLS